MRRAAFGRVHERATTDSHESNKNNTTRAACIMLSVAKSVKTVSAVGAMPNSTREGVSNTWSCRITSTKNSTLSLCLTVDTRKFGLGTRETKHECGSMRMRESEPLKSRGVVCAKTGCNCHHCGCCGPMLAIV